VSPTPLQWSVFSVDLDPTVGSEQAGRRPVLVVSRESANRVLPVVSAIPLTTRRPERQVYPNEALIPRGHAGLNRDSIAMAHQIRTLSKTRLGHHIGRLDDPGIRGDVRAAMRAQLDLD
jgi:mRNA interferase MazF